MSYIDMKLDNIETIVISKEGIKLECGYCPTLYSFNDIKGNEYYIRFRHDYLTLSRNLKDLCGIEILGKLGGGLISYEECCIILLNLGYLINDSLIEDRVNFVEVTGCSSEKGWIAGDELNNILKEENIID